MMRQYSPSGFTIARRTLLAGIGLCVAASTLCANGSLLEHSPFLPPGYGEKPEAPKPVVTAAPTIISRQLEFKGLIELDGVTQFSVFDKKSNEGYWLALNESAGDFEIVRYDERNQSILISSGGRTEELALATPDDSPLQIAGSSPGKGPSVPRTTITQASHSNNSTSKKSGPLIPRRRIVRPSSNSDSSKSTEKRTDTPASPLPPPPPS